MELSKSETLINLAKSFAGEAQAGLRYQFSAELALNQGYKILSDEIKALAKNEVNHAKVFFQAITDGAGELDNIEFTAGYPFKGTTLENGLKFAIEAERDEAHIYEKYAEIAINEGFDEIAKKFKMIAAVERRHADIFNSLYEDFTSGNLYDAKEPKMWICSECGHIETAVTAWSVCPLCSSTQGFVELKLQQEKV